MSEDKKNKKTLSLKLGTKRSFAPVSSFETGKTVIVEKKRLRKSNPAIQSQSKDSDSKKTKNETKEPVNPESNFTNEGSTKSGVVLKPLTKDEQKRILKADTREEKNKAISRIRGDERKENTKPDIIEDVPVETEKYVQDEKKKDHDNKVEEFKERKKPSVSFGRKKSRERKVTIVTALSDVEERTRSLAAYKRAKQKNKKTNIETEPQKKLIREVNIPEHITVKELANRMTEKSGEVIKSLMKMGMMATINESLDADTAELIVTEFGHKFKRENIEDIEKELISEHNVIPGLYNSSSETFAMYK